MEIFFRPLLPEEIERIATNAVRKIGFPDNKLAVEVVKKFATNGREAVNMIQLSVGVAISDGRNDVAASDVEWVANSSQLTPRPEKKIPFEPQVGLVNGLAVYGPNQGMLLEIEVTAIPAVSGTGKYTITGIVDEEEMGGGSKTIRRKSMVRGSIENVLTVLRRSGMNTFDYDLHINFPGGIPIDGPSAGVSMATAIASAIRNVPVDNKLAMTGEISIHGKVKPIGGAVAKVEAAFQAGANRVIIPRENWQDIFAGLNGLTVIPVDTIEEVLEHALNIRESSNVTIVPNMSDVLIASPPPLYHAGPDLKSEG
jgi:Lon-like ATP-dependent protease